MLRLWKCTCGYVNRDMKVKCFVCYAPKFPK